MLEFIRQEYSVSQVFLITKYKGTPVPSLSHCAYGDESTQDLACPASHCLLGHILHPFLRAETSGHIHTSRHLKHSTAHLKTITHIRIIHTFYNFTFTSVTQVLKLVAAIDLDSHSFLSPPLPSLACTRNRFGDALTNKALCPYTHALKSMPANAWAGAPSLRIGRGIVRVCK